MRTDQCEEVKRDKEVFIGINGRNRAAARGCAFVFWEERQLANSK
jgi:hypothetical protein